MQQKEAYKNKNKHPKMTNGTSTNATFGGAWCNRKLTKQQGCHSTTMQINK